MRKIILLSALIYGTAVLLLGGQLQYESGLHETQAAKVSLVPVGDAAFIVPSFDIPVFVDQHRDVVKFKGSAGFLSNLYDGFPAQLKPLLKVSPLKEKPLFIIFHNLRL